MNISLRHVTENDIEQIYKWRNHPSVRKWCFVNRELGLEEHVNYWSARLKDKRNLSFIAVSDGKDIGLVRLDGKDDSYEVNILISPENQARGLGNLTLQKTKELAKELGIKKLTASIKPDNTASKTVFEKNGFEKGRTLKDCVLYHCEL